MSEVEELPNIEVGQVWKNRKAKPTTVFMVHRTYIRTYEPRPNKPQIPPALRVVGALAGKSNLFDPERDLDARSMLKMFPHLWFDTFKPDIPEDK